MNSWKQGNKKKFVKEISEEKKQTEAIETRRKRKNPWKKQSEGKT